MTRPNSFIAELIAPVEFIALDSERLAEAAAETRGQSSLQRGFDALCRDGYANNGVDLALSEVNNPQAKRDILRGAILAHQLVVASVADYDPHTLLETTLDEVEGYDMTLNRQRVTHARRQLVLSFMDSASNDPTAKAEAQNMLPIMVDDVLQASRLNESIDIAVGNLTGEGLGEPPTDLNRARYGAAILSLSITGLDFLGSDL